MDNGDKWLGVGLYTASAYAAIWRKGCTPPDTTSWANPDNN
jgi:hypothetical protein